MNKKVFIDSIAEKELREFSDEVQIEFEAYFIVLREKGKLGFPQAKKIDKNLFELRIKHKGEYRGFYAYSSKNYIIILHFFKKKTQKTPIKNIETVKRRRKQYE